MDNALVNDRAIKQKETESLDDYGAKAPINPGPIICRHSFIRAA